MKIKLAIVDNDERYLGRISTAFNQKYADKLRIYSFTNVEALQQTMTETSASMIDEAKSKLKEEIKGLGDATITVNENYSYFVNGWPKYISEEKIFDINEAKVVTSFEIEWTNIRWQ